MACPCVLTALICKILQLSSRHHSLQVAHSATLHPDAQIWEYHNPFGGQMSGKGYQMLCIVLCRGSGRHTAACGCSETSGYGRPATISGCQRSSPPAATDSLEGHHSFYAEHRTERRSHICYGCKGQGNYVWNIQERTI